MQRPGRRRLAAPSMVTLLSLTLLLFFTTASASSAVLGIDLGTNFIKAVIVKPGTPLDIVLTKDSKRKEASVVAFKPLQKRPVDEDVYPERLYGGDALALSGRFPGEVYTHLKPLLGIDPDVQAYKHEHPAINIQTSPERALAEFISTTFNEKEIPWTVEELIAMQLKNIRTNAEAMTGKGSKITAAVITIPSYFTANERRAVQRAADLAGLEVMGLVSDGLAVGIDYAVKRDFPNVSKGGKPELHMILDVGAASTVASLLRFQGRDVKDVGRFNKTVQEVAVIGNSWDRTLGGNALNGLMVDHMVDAFMKKPEVSSQAITEHDLRSHPRAASKLWREAERARQVLSANSEVRSSFEGLYNDIDFSVKLSRSEFEIMSAAHANRLSDLIKQAVKSADLTLKDLNSIILYGGAVRMPFIQRQLESLVGKSCEIRSNVNADESAAFGAAFKAAGLSPSFKVKEIRDSDAAVYSSGITQTTDAKAKKQQVFVPTSLGGSYKQLPFKQKEDFDFDLYQAIDGGLEQSIVSIKTSNLTASVAALETLGCTKDNIVTKFSMRLSPVSGVPEVSGGTVSCEIEGTGKVSGLGDSVKGLFGFGGKNSDQEVLDDAKTTLGSASASASAKSAASSSKAKTSKKRTEVVNIAFTATPIDKAAPSAEELKRIKGRLAAFEKADKARLKREEALNVLEAFTYKARDLLSDAHFEESSTEAVRSEISSLLRSTSEWLYGDGAQAATDVFKSKLADLRKLVDPVQKRVEEAKQRPGKLKVLESALNSTKNLIDAISEQIVLASDYASSVAAAASSSASTASTSESSAANPDGLDDLEDPEPGTSSSSSSKAAEPSSEIPLSPYSEADVGELQTLHDEISTWIAEKIHAQSKMAAYQDPALTVQEIEVKSEKLKRVTMRLMQKRMHQMPKKHSASKKTAPKTAKADMSGQQSESSSSGGQDPASGPGKATDNSDSKREMKGKVMPGGSIDIENFGDGEMPSEEEILAMVDKLRAKEASIGASKSAPDHGEL